MKVKKHTIAAIIDTHKHATGNAQRGIVTHHHDQFITLHNFNVINTIVSKPKSQLLHKIRLFDVS